MFHTGRTCRTLAASVLAVTLAGCSDASPPEAESPSASESASATPSDSSFPEPTCGEKLAVSLTSRERAGQLVMVGLGSETSPEAVAAVVKQQGLGGVFLLGSWQGPSAKDATAILQDAAPEQANLLIAADQEGGLVQRVDGAGFSTIPSARQRGTGKPATERANAEQWSHELAEAGINVNLAPVADTVAPRLGDTNEPIGALDRDYLPGSPEGNAQFVRAFVTGSIAADVAPTLKHFPGIGRITGNTDTTAVGIQDDTTTATDPYLAPFRAGIDAGAPIVMSSSATYTRIDPDNPAMFSRTVLTDVLRDELGFDGVILSDDVGATASVADVPVKQRAIRIVSAGGDIISSVDPDLAATFIDAIVARASSRPAFANQVRAAAARVLDVKASLDLVDCG